MNVKSELVISPNAIIVINPILECAATANAIPVSWLVSGGLHKTPEIAQARIWAIDKLTEGLRIKHEYRKILVRTTTEVGEEHGWREPSTTILGELMGMDHSSIIQARKRANYNGYTRETS